MSGGVAADEFIGRTIDELPTPSLIADVAVVRKNVAGMARRMSGFGVSLRPHWKTSKSVDVARMQIEAGAIGMTAATAGEVESLASAGLGDIFWAYPPVGSARISTMLRLARSGELIVGVDSVQSLAEAAAAAAAAGVRLKVRMEVDTGLERTGVRPENAVDAARSVSSLPSVMLEGIYTHEGQVQGIGADAAARERAGLHAGKVLVDAAAAIRADGHELRSVSVGSTPGAASAPSVRGITEARPGTYVFGDENQVAIGTIDSQSCALTLIARTISVQPAGAVIVDAGIKALSSDGSLHHDGRIGTVVDEVGTATGAVVSTGYEEHGKIRGPFDLRVGDLVRIRPNHACGAVNMHSKVYAVDRDIVTAIWPTTGRH